MVASFSFLSDSISSIRSRGSSYRSADFAACSTTGSCMLHLDPITWTHVRTRREMRRHFIIRSQGPDSDLAHPRFDLQHPRRIDWMAGLIIGLRQVVRLYNRLSNLA